jgi:FlaA1/EpsC-like NDP-sugar epimerase
MIDFIYKIFKNSFIGKRFHNLGYLPRWIIFAIDVFIVCTACLVTYIIVTNINEKSYELLSIPTQNILIIAVNALSFIFFRTYAGIIRHSTFIDGVKLLIATSVSYVTLMSLNYFYNFFFDIKIFLSTGLFITYVISFLQLFLFRILVKFFFERYMQVNDTKKLIRAVIYGADANAISVANALKTEKPSRFNVVAFVDKYKQTKTSKSILDLPIISQSKDIHVILRSLSAEALIILKKD